jgi:hypothetical protein
MGVAHHALRGESIDGIDSTHTRPVSILRGELIGSIESTLACPGTTLEHTAFFSVRTSIVIVIVSWLSSFLPGATDERRTNDETGQWSALVYSQDTGFFLSLSLFLSPADEMWLG